VVQAAVPPLDAGQLAPPSASGRVVAALQLLVRRRQRLFYNRGLASPEGLGGERSMRVVVAGGEDDVEPAEVRLRIGAPRDRGVGRLRAELQRVDLVDGPDVEAATP